MLIKNLGVVAAAWRAFNLAMLKELNLCGDLLTSTNLSTSKEVTVVVKAI